jgi:hypothetical protein
VFIKLRQRQADKQHEATTAETFRRRLNNGNVVIVYGHELEVASNPESLSLDGKWKRTEEADRKVVT